MVAETAYQEDTVRRARGGDALYFAVIRHRLLFEEGMLVNEFGDEYREYMKRTKRLIPLY